MTVESRLKVVVEGPTDAEIIRAILGKELARKLRFFASQGRASLATVGRNILVHEGGPILLVMDSDTLNPQHTAELQSMIMVAMSGAITSGVQLPAFPTSSPAEFMVFTFVPEIEAVFFEAPEAVERAVGKNVPKDKVKEGRLMPKRTLVELLNEAKPPRSYQTIIAAMDAEIGQAIASGKQAKALRAMVESMLVSSAKP